MKKGGNLNDSLQHCDGGAVVSLVVRSVRLLLQLLQLGGFQQLVLSLLVVRRAHQLQKKKTTRFCLSTYSGSLNYPEAVIRRELTTASKSSRASCVLPCFSRMFPLCNLACREKKMRGKRKYEHTDMNQGFFFFLKLCDLTARKSGLSSIALVRSGRADLDFPMARKTAALL